MFSSESDCLSSNLCKHYANNNKTTKEQNKKMKQINFDFKSNNKKKDINFNNNGVKKNKPVEVRKEEVMAIRNRFPTKIPIIVQRFNKEKYLPNLDKNKFLVPQEITMSQFHTIIKSKMPMNHTHAMYLLVNNRSMVCLSLTLAEVYAEHAGPDGFLYITYASQEVFGSPQSVNDTTNWRSIISN